LPAACLVCKGSGNVPKRSASFDEKMPSVLKKEACFLSKDAERFRKWTASF
jgi:hypothetical protein